MTTTPGNIHAFTTDSTLEELKVLQKVYIEKGMKADNIVDKCIADHTNSTIKNCIKILESHTDWISRSERLPTDRSLRYEVFTPSDDMVIRHRFCNCDNVRIFSDATHWRVAQSPI